MLDVGKLATLRAVVVHGSFSAAGQALNLTQPAVSWQVSLLERRLGTQLVPRTQQGVLPTEAGRLLVEHADAILGRLALAEAEVADVAGLRRGRLRLASASYPRGPRTGPPRAFARPRSGRRGRARRPPRGAARPRRRRARPRDRLRARIR